MPLLDGEFGVLCSSGASGNGWFKLESMSVNAKAVAVNHWQADPFVPMRVRSAPLGWLITWIGHNNKSPWPACLLLVVATIGSQRTHTH